MVVIFTHIDLFKTIVISGNDGYGSYLSDVHVMSCHIIFLILKAIVIFSKKKKNHHLKLRVTIISFFFFLKLVVNNYILGVCRIRSPFWSELSTSRDLSPPLASHVVVSFFDYSLDVHVMSYDKPSGTRIL